MKLKDAIKDIRKGDYVIIYFMDDEVTEDLEYPVFKIDDLTSHYKDAILDYVVYAIEQEQEEGWTEIYLTGNSKDLTK